MNARNELCCTHARRPPAQHSDSEDGRRARQTCIRARNCRTSRNGNFYTATTFPDQETQAVETRTCHNRGNLHFGGIIARALLQSHASKEHPRSGQQNLGRLQHVGNLFFIPKLIAARLALACLLSSARGPPRLPDQTNLFPPSNGSVTEYLSPGSMALIAPHEKVVDNNKQLLAMCSVPCGLRVHGFWDQAIFTRTGHASS